MDIIGIDVGTVRIKYVRLEKKSGRYNLVSSDYFDYKGTDENLGEIIEIIASREGTNHEVVIGLTSQDIFKKSFTIPVMPKEEIKEAVTWSASKVISIPIEDTYYEFDVLGDVDERGIKKRDIFLTGIEKVHADRIIDLFKDKGFKKITLLTDPSFVYAPYLKDITSELSVVIDLGGRITGIYIVENGKSLFVREILTASESFTDALMSGFGYSYEEAEQYKKEYGFTEKSEEKLSVTLERLVGEVQRTLAVFTQKYPDKAIKRLYLTGGGSKIPNLIERLRNYFAEDITNLELPFEMDEAFLPAYLLCIKRPLLFNLLPPEIKSQEKEEFQKKWIRIGTVALLSVLVIVSINLIGAKRRLDSAIDLNRSLISKKKQQLSELSGLASVSRYKELMPLMEDIKKRDVTYISLLRYISSRLPKDIYIKEVYLEMPVPLQSEVSKKDDQAKTPQSLPQQPSQQPKPKKEATGLSEGVYLIKLKGYIFGEKNLLESTLLELIIRLEESGFIYSVDVSGKDIKTLRGMGVMEFEIKGRCATHEV
ncbi:MAG TPA: pilus assembly protein PilM [Syntrophorhabdaceae bacterium]|nr:pilus assembly protein PilM [Syntrophorhabdaceae bacterium]HQH43631.1 pilus assembly protein PilM [Syntrophorhabdaceae bacterium]HQK46952.1 pilus assembly protein PilM [Syntrophorhabdaceae bacterium]HRR72226.1 pilus assembly protein PilM [Syntrophorhabdaceae bacterium]HRV23054.1 pilus assembly protein PilM [Syntrophorhabdaceae bacterium]